ncbi:MAG: sugar transferase [Anaerolineae bacterium]|nr:sugar transferase [Thermoflexales bacterium]MDW8395606.1 sugar transferase [Anaerolineae bacterium]
MPAPFKVNRFLLDVGIDTGLAVFALWLSTLIRPLLPFGRRLREADVDWPVYLLVALVWAAVFPHFNLYVQRPHRLRHTFGALVLATGIALLIMAGALYLTFRELSRLQFITFGLITLVLLSAAHLGRAVRRRRQDEQWRVLIVGASELGKALAERLTAQPSRVRVIGFLDDARPAGSLVCAGVTALGKVDDAARIADEQSVDEVILALPREHYPRLLELIADLEALPIQLSLAPDVLDLAWFLTRVEDLNGVPVLRLRQSPLDGPIRAVKRLMDLLIGATMLVCTLPLMALIAIAIKLDSPGPALIRQTRIGEGGRPFQMYKFRTMRVGAEHPLPAGSYHKRPNDPRVTRLGRWLRRYSLDELPQLFNVLKGEMSLVGPRPELPWLVERYQTWQRRRFAVPPGMTGWWQINGRSERPMHLHVEDDLHYIRNYSLWLDLVILVRTIPVVLSGRGAF